MHVKNKIYNVLIATKTSKHCIYDKEKYRVKTVVQKCALIHLQVQVIEVLYTK